MAPTAVNCPSCGAPFEVRYRDNAVNVVCSHCFAVLDARSPDLQILQTSASIDRSKPLIPLGRRGTLRGTKYEAIGFQHRTITVEGVQYTWHEYLLFNPYEGYRYLSEYDGHWNDIRALKSPPEGAAGEKTVSHLGRTFRVFQTDTATTTFVLGEFPWQVRVGDKVSFYDYISPPYILSAEMTEDETTWSMGEYIEGEKIWQAFGMPGTAPPAVGVFANQPSPRPPTGPLWKQFALFAAAALVLFLVLAGMARNERVLTATFQFDPKAEREGSVVTDVFELKGHASNVGVDVTATVDQSWAFFNVALINAVTGDAWNFSKEVSYYHGVDSDGSWSEGSPQGAVTVPTIPPGRYYLRIEPESGNETATPQPISYTVTVWRDQPSILLLLAALVLLLPVPLLAQMRRSGFEGKRWQESSYTSSGSTRPADDEEE